MPDPVHPVLDASARFQAQLLARERTAAVRLVNAYGGVYQRLQASIDALADAIAMMPNPTPGRIRELSALKSLRAQIEEQIARYGQYADVQLEQDARQALASGLQDWQQLTLLSLPETAQASVMGVFRVLNVPAVETMVGFLAPTSPLHDALTAKLGPAVAEKVADRLIRGVALGLNPRKVAREMVREELGQGLTWSLTTARTATLWAYREAQRASQVANAHIAPRWIWSAALDMRTCGSCFAMHGTVHDAAEPLNDHYNGRCQRVPLSVSWQELGVDLPDMRPEVVPGLDKFKALTPEKQRAILGPGKYEWWQNGGDFSRLSTAVDSPIYGPMRTETTLRELVGGA